MPYQAFFFPSETISIKSTSNMDISSIGVGLLSHREAITTLKEIEEKIAAIIPAALL